MMRLLKIATVQIDGYQGCTIYRSQVATQISATENGNETTANAVMQM
jgi:hypothetical protein